jgi:hypothetical protein
VANDDLLSHPDESADGGAETCKLGVFKDKIREHVIGLQQGRDEILLCSRNVGVFLIQLKHVTNHEVGRYVTTCVTTHPIGNDVEVGPGITRILVR